MDDNGSLQMMFDIGRCDRGLRLKARYYQCHLKHDKVKTIEHLIKHKTMGAVEKKCY